MQIDHTCETITVVLYWVIMRRLSYIYLNPSNWHGDVRKTGKKNRCKCAHPAVLAVHVSFMLVHWDL